MRTSVYEAAGGAEAMWRLAEAHHVRCLADEELNHPFSHDDLDPEHIQHLALYWGEVLGGPPTYSDEVASHASMLRMHAGNGPGMVQLAPRFVDCFVGAMDDAGLPADPELRATLRAYMEWAVDDVNAIPEKADVPAKVAMPHWSWDGLQQGLTR